MSFFSSHIPTTMYRLIVDVAPQGVGIGLTIHGSTKLEFVDRQTIHYGRRPSMKQMQTKLAALLREMIRTSIVPRLHNAKIQSVLCIHSAAWSVAETHTIDVRFPQPIKVEEKMIVDSIHDHRSQAVLYAHENNLDLVYHRLQRVKLNGYYTDSPWQKMAQSISCDLIEGYVDSIVKKFCDNELSRYCEKITHVPEGFVVYHAAQKVIPHMEDVLIVHVGGETTEIICCDKEYVRKTASTPTGISNVVRAISSFVHGSESLAYSHITMAAKGYRTPTKKEQVVINSCIDQWRTDFVKGLEAACSMNTPEHIYFFSAVHSMSIAQHMIDAKAIGAWSGKKHTCQRLFDKKTFQHDFMIAAGAGYVVE